MQARMLYTEAQGVMRVDLKLCMSSELKFEEMTERRTAIGWGQSVHSVQRQQT